ncbi:uncharacterized protein ATC70_006085 [Mucor velutinosus]|uniref:Uncharacterized protein n=1 Tax=Mucor velutinosus TaxID=708070 RepID=A0AAN7DBY9_9FUNG|nr:hypothetical protein ATC70_006085 [Mucor velutinosus]
MITSQHVILFIFCVTILHYIFEPRDVSMKGLLYLKQLFDERCQINAPTFKSVPGLSYLNYLETLYYKFNNVNVTACRLIDLSVPGKPSAQLIAGMSHLYTRNSTIIKSPLANELLIESILAKGNLAHHSALDNMEHLWIYMPLVFFIMYPFLHDSAISCYHSMKDSLFDGGFTRISNNVYIDESTTEANNTPEEPTATSRRSSADSSIGSIHLDYTNAAARNWTAEELLAEETKSRDPAEERNEMPFEPSKSQRFWSSFQPARSYPFTLSGHSSDSSGNNDNGNRFQFPTAPGGPHNESNSLPQGDAPGSPDTNAEQTTPKPSQKVAYPLDSSFTLNSDFSNMPFVPPTGPVSERFPESTNDEALKLTLNLPFAVLGPSNVTNPPVPVVLYRSKAAQSTGRYDAPKSCGEKDNPPFDGHFTPPEQPKFACRTMPHADEIARFAAKKQSVNDFADQMGAFLRRITFGDLPTSNTAAGSKQQTSSTGVKPPASTHTKHLPEQAFKKAPLKGDADSTKGQRGKSSQKKKASSQKAEKPKLSQQEPSNIRFGAPPPAGPSSSSTKIGSSLTEAIANAPFMPRKKMQPKAASTTMKLLFSRFKADPDDLPTDASNVVGQTSFHQNQPTYAPGSLKAESQFSSSSVDETKKKVSPKSSLSPKPRLAYSPGSLRSPTAGIISQVKRAPVFTSSFKHLKDPSSIHTVANASSRCNRSTPPSNIEAPVDIISSTAPDAFGSDKTKTSSLPVFLMGNRPPSSTDQVSLETELALNLSDENFFATTAFGIVEPLKPDSSPVAPSTNCKHDTEAFGNLAAAFLASDPQILGRTIHFSESNDDGFDSVGLLAADTTEPPVAAASAGKEESKKTQVTANISAASNSTPSIKPNDATHDAHLHSSTITAREAKRKDLYTAKVATTFPLAATKEHTQKLAAAMYISPPASGTSPYTSIFPSATAATAVVAASSIIPQQYAESPSSAASFIDRSPILLADTNNSIGEQGTNANEAVSSLLICQPAEAVEIPPPEGLLQSLKKKAKEQASQQASQQVKAKNKGKGKGKSNKKKKRRRRR